MTGVQTCALPIYVFEVDQIRIQIEEFKRKGDFNKVAELQYGKLPALELQLKEAQDHEDGNTDDAILSGCMVAQSGAIEHAFAQHGAAVCILSGGAAPSIAPLLTVPYQLVDNIVLVGLHAAAGEPDDQRGSPC